MKYRSKVIIEAIKHNPKNKFEILELVKTDKTFKRCEFDDYETATLEFQDAGGKGYPLTIRIGEYLVKRDDGYKVEQANKFEDGHDLVGGLHTWQKEILEEQAKGRALRGNSPSHVILDGKGEAAFWDGYLDDKITKNATEVADWREAVRNATADVKASMNKLDMTEAKHRRDASLHIGIDPTKPGADRMAAVMTEKNKTKDQFDPSL